jgi:hypothetical protein
MVVNGVPVCSDALSCASCIGGGETLQSLRGLRISAGWGREVRARAGGAHACTHLTELLISLATIVLQALAPLRHALPDRLDTRGKPVKIDSCFGCRADGEQVKSGWAEFCRADGSEWRVRGLHKRAGVSLNRRSARNFNLETVASFSKSQVVSNCRDL